MASRSHCQVKHCSSLYFVSYMAKDMRDMSLIDLTEELNSLYNADIPPCPVPLVPWTPAFQHYIDKL